MTENYGESPCESPAVAKALERLGLKHKTNALPNFVLLERELLAGENREIPISRDSALGGLVKTVEYFDLDEVKEVIGLPDRLAQRNEALQRDELCVQVKDLDRYSPSALEKAYDEGTMTAEQQRFLQKVGRTYVFGYSPLVQAFKAVLQKVYTRGASRFDITSVCFGTLRIRNGYSLVLTPSIQSLCIDRLLLEPNARVIRTGNVDINFNIGRIRVVQPDFPIAAQL